MNVLVIANTSAESRRAILELLTLRGDVVEVATSLQEALTLLHQQSFHCVLLDLRTVENAPLELFCKLRGQSKAKDVFWLVLAERSQKNQLLEVLKAGAQDFLFRPLDPFFLETRLIIAQRAALQDDPGAYITHEDLADTEPLMRSFAEHLELNAKLAQLHRTKDELLATSIQELRASLVPCLGYIDLLLASGFGPISEKITSRMKVTAKNLRRMSRVIDGMMNYYQLIDETFIKEPHVAAVDLTLLVREVIEEFTSRTCFDTSHLALEIDEPLPFVNADPQMIKTALSSLLDNVAMHAGPDVHVRLTLKGPVAGEIQISVEDDGIGIPEHIRSRVFEPFIKPANAAPECLGLGLTMVRAILTAHKSDVFLKTDEGRGTTISFWLPVAVDS